MKNKLSNGGSRVKVSAKLVIEGREALRSKNDRLLKVGKSLLEKLDTSEIPVVVPRSDGMFSIVVGNRQFRSAIASGEQEVEVEVREDLTAEQASELRLAEYYKASLVRPMGLGRAFIKHREHFNVTQQELARRTGITPGTIHHYESLIRTLDPMLGASVDSGDLTFKEARSIADISDFARQREIAKPFIKGRLSSVYVERIVGLAKSAPTLSVEEIINRIVNGERAQDIDQRHQADPVHTDTGRFEPARLESTVLKLAGELDALQLKVIPEYLRLKLISSLRILDTRVGLALDFLNGGPAADSEIPLPMTARERRPASLQQDIVRERILR